LFSYPRFLGQRKFAKFFAKYIFAKIRKMALSLSRASLYCTFLGIVIFCIFTISSYVQIHLLLHFRNFSTIHTGPRGEGDVEVLAYVNSNLIVVHQDPSGSKPSSSSNNLDQLPLVKVPSAIQSNISSTSRTKVPHTQNHSETQKINSDSVTVKSVAVIKNPKSDIQANNEMRNDENKETKTKINNAKTETKKPSTKKETVLQNFTVEGWPENKSRNAEDYVNYDQPTATLIPQKPFSSASSDDISNPQVLVVVQSAPKNKLLREEVRRTWGHACVTTHSSWCSLVFILGELANQDRDPLQSELEQEYNQYGDILQDAFLDSYNNLTIKSIHILKYFVSISDQIGNKYLLKTDDDSFIHLEALWDLAKARLEKKSNHLIGYLQLGLKKHHYLPLAHKPTTGNLKKTTWLKWLIPTYMYNKKFFPQFLSGSGYLLTRQASECLLQKSKTIPIVHLEDVYITGLCAASCHLRREHNKGFKARKMEKINEYNIQLSDVVIHYATGQMDRFFDQTIQLKNENLDDLTAT